MKKYMIAKYIRLSMEDLDLCDSEEKVESVSISNQKNFLNVFMEQKEEFKGAEVREFVDDGYSGTNFDRPAMKEMLRLCRQGEINCIIVKDLSRFGRNYLEVGDYLEQIFPFLGIRFISINDGFDSKNFFGQTGGMDVAFKNFIYEMYSRDLSEKVKSGVTTCMKRGEYYAGCMVYGYQKSSDGKRMEIDEGAATTIRRIFRELADGKSAKTLAIELNAEGVPTRLAYKQSKGEQLNRHYKADIWNRNKIHSIIHNRVYQGDMVYRKAVRTKVGSKRKVTQPEEKWFVIPEHHEAIVSRELFKKANDSIRKGKQQNMTVLPFAGGLPFVDAVEIGWNCGKPKHHIIYVNEETYWMMQRAMNFVWRKSRLRGQYGLSGRNTVGCLRQFLLQVSMSSRVRS